MRLRSVVIAIVVILLLAAAVGYALAWRPAIAPIADGAKPTRDIKLVMDGSRLAAIGDCSTCHTATRDKPYAGGVKVPTPFGTIYSTNITPDEETGIGRWSEEAFRRAMREGVRRNGQHLYPAFPYDHFTRATDEDIRAIYAFLMSQTAVRDTPPENELMFPLGFRPLLAGWKLLFLDPGPRQPDAGQDAEWNRGRYLTEGLGHCSACHTPRNVLGAEKKDRKFAGGQAEGWDAPSLYARTWTVDQLTNYLATGWDPTHGAAMGPMADVANDLRQVPRADVRAIAVYVASFSAQAGQRPQAGEGPQVGERSQAGARVQAGAGPEPGNEPTGGTAPTGGSALRTSDVPADVLALYEGACRQCHRDSGEGSSMALPLSRSIALRLENPRNAAHIVMSGIGAYRYTGGPYMPAFDGMLDDRQIAAILDLVRTRYTNEPRWDNLQEKVAKARQEATR